ncbi:retroviral-like aspartic protease family protein, partial [Patescibacteria group bacterium]|nr:retroviral-like aspartic protease family protein [Patescibacteria group bacterium]
MAFKLYQQTEVNWKLVAGLKIVVFVGIILVVGLGFAWQKKNAQINQAKVKIGFSGLINQADGAILTIPYQQTIYKHFGNAINPQVKIPVKTITGYKNVEFLIDSGAVVSALPKTMAEDLGVNLSELPRITIEGFAGQKTFAYRGEFVLMIGNEEVVIPVVFSENPQASNSLGRIG